MRGTGTGGHDCIMKVNCGCTMANTASRVTHGCKGYCDGEVNIGARGEILGVSWRLRTWLLLANVRVHRGERAC